MTVVADVLEEDYDTQPEAIIEDMRSSTLTRMGTLKAGMHWTFFELVYGPTG